MAKFWKEGDLWCRAMLDIINKTKPWAHSIWDIKTTTSVHPKKIANSISQSGKRLYLSISALMANKFTLRNFGLDVEPRPETNRTNSN